MISIIVPVFNEAKGIQLFLESLWGYRREGVEIIVVDGGSTDETVDLAVPLCDHCVSSGKGRAKQMNAGASSANGDILLFLHADTLLPVEFISLVTHSLSKDQYLWGRFNVRLSGNGLSLRLIAFFMNYRSRLTSIATGDQAIFVKASIFKELNGYEDIPLMEDVALSKSLKKISSPVCLQEQVISSSRRWEKFGIWRTVFLMWRLRLAYFFGADPHQLAIRYE